MRWKDRKGSELLLQFVTKERSDPSLIETYESASLGLIGQNVSYFNALIFLYSFFRC
jgi:hypothetical protein